MRNTSITVGLSVLVLSITLSVLDPSYRSSASNQERALPIGTPTSAIKVVSGWIPDLTSKEWDGTPITKTEAEWKKVMSSDQFYVLRNEGTERAFTGKYTDNHEKGTYHCAACGLVLFSSAAKFDSGTGWPSFFQPLYKKNIREKPDRSLAEERIEVECAPCGSHIGHVFDDGPPPTGSRYCLNSVSLVFQKKK
ncbi:MAG: peptide-methionine (R)-S-oxide reductase MsrB [Pyrinomonadaceae bacterium]